jgi:hypothetical protein
MATDAELLAEGAIRNVETFWLPKLDRLVDAMERKGYEEAARARDIYRNVLEHVRHALNDLSTRD